MRMTKDVRWLDQRLSAGFSAALGGANQPNMLTTTQLIAMEAINDLPGASQQALVLATSIDRSTLATVVQKLAANGYAERVDNQADMRAYMVTLTKAGYKVLTDGRSKLAKVEKGLLTEAKALVAAW